MAKNDAAPSQPTPAPQEGQGQPQPKGSLKDWAAKIEALLQQAISHAPQLISVLEILAGLLAGKQPMQAPKPAHQLIGSGLDECHEAALCAALQTVAAVLHCQAACDED